LNAVEMGHRPSLLAVGHSEDRRAQSLREFLRRLRGASIFPDCQACHHFYLHPFHWLERLEVVSCSRTAPGFELA